MGLIWTDEPNQYPFGPLPRRLILAGKKRDGQLRGELVKLAAVAERKREGFRNDVTMVEETGAVMREITPPIQSDEERGTGDSTNSRMHRILNG